MHYSPRISDFETPCIHFCCWEMMVILLLKASGDHSAEQRYHDPSNVLSSRQFLIDTSVVVAVAVQWPSVTMVAGDPPTLTAFICILYFGGLVDL